MALDADGNVWAWGSNDSGQLGLGNTPSELPSSSTPVIIGSVSGFRAISAGGGHAMAVRDNGTAYAWGANDYGQLGLGIGNTTDKYEPVTVGLLVDIKDVSAGAWHSGTVRAWGYNGDGQLGIGNTTDQHEPVTIGDLSHIRQIVATQYNSMALEASGYLYAWGDNTYGQVGDLSTIDRPSPVLIDVLGSKVTSMAGGGLHSMAMKHDGMIRTWGDNTFGQLGNGTNEPEMFPTLLTVITGMVSIEEKAYPRIDEGTKYTIALKADGNIWGWGDNYTGQLGDGTYDFRYMPTQTSGLSNAISISAGNLHALALKADGTVWAWGASWAGQRGDGGGGKVNQPVQVHHITNAVDISACWDFSLAATSDGSVWAWGNNNVRQLGIGNTTTQYEPVRLTGISNVTSISCGREFSAAVRSNGKVMAWGSNAWGQLGIGNTDEQTGLANVLGGLEKVKSIAAGGYHLLAIQADGTIESWGRNWQGQLGLGNFTGHRALPEQVLNIDTAVMVDAGELHSVALLADGTVRTWGHNGDGQLGDGSSSNKHTPQDIGLSGITTVSAGYNHNMAVSSDGSVDSWGWDANNQLGTGELKMYQPYPVSVVSSDQQGLMNSVGRLDGMRRSPISMNHLHALALNTQGNVSAWGYAHNAQLGEGTSGYGLYNTVAAQSAMDNAVSISGGWGYSVALKQDGTVWTWGENISGVLGQGLADNVKVAYPAAVANLPGIVVVEAGPWHVMALDGDGNVWAWGPNNFGQLGVIGGSEKYNVPVKTGLTNIVDIAAGANHSYALESDGTVWAMGTNDYGELGQGDTSTYTEPVRVKNLSGVKSIEAGALYGIALLSDGTVKSWGSNTWKSLGTGWGAYRALPATVWNLDSVAYIESGDWQVLAVKGDGSVWGWGRNSQGQLGIDPATPYFIEPVLLDYISEPRAVSSGNFATMFLKADGTLWSVGGNSKGQLGIGNAVDTHELTRVLGLGGEGFMNDIGTDVPSVRPSIAGGYLHSLGLKADGTVMSWGYNGYGQLGDNTYNKYTSAPVQVSGLINAVSVATGAYHSAALDSAGKVWTWGDNRNGQLGDNTNTQRHAPVEAYGLSNVVTIASGLYHMLALTSEGDVYAWGSNGQGQLGQNTVSMSSSNEPIQVSGLSNVISVSASAYSSAALTAGGEVYTWGDNEVGQLGRNSGTDDYEPDVITGLGNIVSISSGWYHTVARTDDGTVYAWGDNYAGQICDSTSSIKYSPVHISNWDGKYVRKVAAGGGSTYALGSDGRVWACGDNMHGQLGVGSLTDSGEPVEITELSGIIDIDAGDYHCVAYDTAGHALSWGLNSYGQLGDGADLNVDQPVDSTFIF
jgi:alpha-tubulin suppressor-like RCC1 family protein